ncbi:tetratricopeptide repeat protein [Sinimarinibacterium sp. CAU 1509]|uniref:tetratricopeptide repeat-containing sulfotransferase family protein n=1 Tax=Sinimarinibacterium sp. CAU 1509 TaxID=2562283 RepID=UPI0010ACBF36|nr:tetratricopeptide repeat-containing sulfotransferase family protein [Sinimarinibacterium sp. CAU 1509]TJY59277.1 tetratricopeptide repeat protein [Sinimarinibacterium sp. CAU 1509]
MSETSVIEHRERLQKAFDELGAGRLDVARREFMALCLQPACSVDAYRGLAAVSWRAGQPSSSVEFLRQAVTIDPQHPDARADLALMLLMAGRLADALPEWEKVAEMRPDDADVWHNLGKLLGDLGQPARASAAFERSLALKPGRVPTLVAYARMLANSGDEDAAEAMWLRIIGLQPQAADSYQGLAELQFARGQLAQSLATYRRGCEAVPDSPEMHMGRAQLLEDLGDRVEAEAAFRQVLALRPDWPLALEALLTLIQGKAEDALITRARSIVTDSRRPPPDRANVGFGLGKALDARGDTEDAFAIWQLANAARRAQVGPYDHALLMDRIDRTIGAYTPERIASLSGLGDPDERPVFVLGMPRSGTSLVEQIIAAHPDAVGYGELKDISRLARGMPTRAGSIQRWPEALSAVGATELKAAAADYLAALRRRDSSASRRCVDKAPLNFYHVGLIALMFPNARIVWCRRDPRDICVSIYAENFALEQRWANDLADLGRFYRQHLRLMRHWQTLLPGRLHECVYEDLVADPESRARALIDAIGLPWNDACLRFHEQDRAVLTPSRWQVRQPMYSKSVARWKRYERWIAPLVEALGDEVQA